MDCLVGLIDAVHDHASHSAPGPGLRDRDVVDGLSIAVVELVRRPAGGEAWLESQLVDVKPHAQERLDDETVHPAGGTGIPSPAAPPGVRFDRINIGGDDVRLDPVGR